MLGIQGEKGWVNKGKGLGNQEKGLGIQWEKCWVYKGKSVGYTMGKGLGIQRKTVGDTR